MAAAKLRIGSTLTAMFLCAACGGSGGAAQAPGTPVPDLTLYAGALGTDAAAGGNSDGSLLSARFYEPQALAFDGAGNLFVADSGNRSIRKINTAGQVTTVAGAPIGALGMSFDTAGNMLVTDGLDYSIKKVTPAGAVSTVALLPRGENNTRGAVLASPTSVATDLAGNVYVANMLGIRNIAPDGSYRILLGVDTVSNANSTTAIEHRGLLMGVDGRLVGTYGAAIYRFDASGKAEVLAGDPEQTGALDGAGGAARFSRSMMLAQDKSGNLYAADINNATIRRITPAGVVTTVAGTKDVFDTVLGKLPGSMRPKHVAVAPNGELYVVSDNAVLKIHLP